MTPLIHKMADIRHMVDMAMGIILAVPDGKERRVVEAMRYATLGGGKAFRPFLVMTIADMLGVPQERALQTAVALEMVHTYSLIHDDLPAMDNDTMRRGKPTCHIQFDEATAILAGDGLLTKAFEVLANKRTHPKSSIRCALISEIAKAAGTQGMIGGQMIDLTGEKTPLNLYEVERMQSMKTGALLRFSCIAPAILAGVNSDRFEALETYADAMGLMFQITDDILDIEGDCATVGKTLGKDAKANKSTFVSLLGLEEARQMAKNLGAKAIQSLDIFEEKAELLKQTVTFILARNK